MIGLRGAAQADAVWGARVGNSRDAEAACLAGAEGVVNQQAVGRESGSVCERAHAAALSGRTTAVGTDSISFSEEPAIGAPSLTPLLLFLPFLLSSLSFALPLLSVLFLSRASPLERAGVGGILTHPRTCCSTSPRLLLPPTTPGTSAPGSLSVARPEPLQQSSWGRFRVTCGRWAPSRRAGTHASEARVVSCEWGWR